MTLLTSLFSRFSFILSVAVALVSSTCLLKENKDNILASRMEGAWVVDEDVTDIIAPSTYETFGIREFIITRDESSLESIKDSYCEDYDEVPFYITGKAEATTFENETYVYGEITKDILLTVQCQHYSRFRFDYVQRQPLAHLPPARGGGGGRLHHDGGGRGPGARHLVFRNLREWSPHGGLLQTRLILLIDL